MRKILMLALMTTGCFAPTYVEATHATATSMRGRFVVEAEGNGRSTIGQLVSYVERKASELCPRGYDISPIGSETETKSVVRVGETFIPIVSKDLVVIVNCRQPPKAVTPPTETYPDETPLPTDASR